MLILCFLNLFSVLIFFFLHSLHRFCSYSFLSFFFFLLFSHFCPFIFLFHNFFFPLLFFFLSVISVGTTPLVAAYIFAVSFTRKKKKKERKKYSHLQKSSFQIHIMMSAGERSGVFIPTKPRPVDTVFILFFLNFSVSLLSFGEASQPEAESITERDAAVKQIFHLTPCRALE